LLAQAFPNLTATQIVNLLMTTATDAGATGTDSVYGRGILNLAAAFQPQGSTSLAGSAVPVSLAKNAVLSPAMGDAGASAAPEAVILDSYQRAYRLNLASTVARMAASQPLFTAIGQDIRSNMVDLGGASVAMRFAGSRSLADRNVERWAGRDVTALSNHPQTAARAVGGAMSLNLAKNTTAFASFGERIDAAPAPAASWLIANAPADTPGFDAKRGIALGIRHQMGRWGLTVTGEQGSALRQQLGETTPRYTLVTARADRALGVLRIGASLGMMRESGSVLGARFSSALGGGGASTQLADLDLALALDTHWTLRGQLREALTKADTGGILTHGHLASNAFALDLVRQGRTDRVGLRLAQPLRVSTGSYHLRLPSGYDYATLATSYSNSILDLAPHGRELDIEGNYGRMLGAGWIDGNLYLRREPGNIASVSNDIGAAIRFTLGF